MSDQTRVRDMERLVLRLPSHIRERLERRAAAQGRSMNAEAAFLLEGLLDATPEAIAQRGLREYRRVLRSIKDTEERLADLTARRDAMRPAIKAWMEAAGNLKDDD